MSIIDHIPYTNIQFIQPGSSCNPCARIGNGIGNVAMTAGLYGAAFAITAIALNALGVGAALSSAASALSLGAGVIAVGAVGVGVFVAGSFFFGMLQGLWNR